jgi:hypothetical protein
MNWLLLLLVFILAMWFFRSCRRKEEKYCGCGAVA